MALLRRRHGRLLQLALLLRRHLGRRRRRHRRHGRLLQLALLLLLLLRRRRRCRRASRRLFLGLWSRHHRLAAAPLLALALLAPPLDAAGRGAGPAEPPR
jgi:hypothetical protein